MASKDIMISKAEYDDMVRSVVLLYLILNSTGSAYDLELTVNNVRSMLGVDVHKEVAKNA